MPALPLAAPRGLRDLLPEAAASIAGIQARIARCFQLAGYQRVTTPAFEYADVLERGLEVDRNEVVRFVEPDTGEVALLRPDITPQIARIVATRLSGRPSPHRLSYQGTVIRRRHGRARRSRMAAQAGIECIGVAGLKGDLEVMGLACAALQSVGLPVWRLELCEVAIARKALSAVPKEGRQGAMDALAQKDRRLLESHASSAGLSAKDTARLVALVDLYGGREVIDEARRHFPDFAKELDDLEGAFAAIDDRLSGDDGASVSVDLGELRGHGYYTGLSFSLLAPGPGARLGGGGRYDGLLASFGQDLPATGLGIDLHHLEWALSKANIPSPAPRPLRAIVFAEERVEGLRRKGIVAAVVEGDTAFALAYGRAWGYDVIVDDEGVSRVSDGTRRSGPIDNEEEIRAWARGE